jgi:hypothetical protein
VLEPLILENLPPYELNLFLRFKINPLHSSLLELARRCCDRTRTARKVYMEKQLPLYITHDLDDWELNLNLFQVT